MTQGSRSAYAAAGAANPQELADLRATAALAGPLARLDAAASAASTQDAELDAGQAEVERLAAELAAARTGLDDARALLARHDARLLAATDQARRAGHERELAAERRDL